LIPNTFVKDPSGKGQAKLTQLVHKCNLVVDGSKVLVLLVRQNWKSLGMSILYISLAWSDKVT